MFTKYFEGEITDGEVIIRIVGFDRDKREQLVLNEGKTVILSDCQIQHNKFNGKLEILIKGYTRIAESDPLFEVSDISTFGSEKISIRDVPMQHDNNRVTVSVNIIKIDEPKTVGNNKLKQDITIADETGMTTLTLWDDNINKLQAGSSYQLSRLIVCTFRGKTSLKLPTTGATIKAIDHIEVNHTIEDVPDEILENNLPEARVVGIQLLENVMTCICCKKGLVEPTTNQGIGKCQICSTVQLLESTNHKMTAKLYVSSGSTTKTLRAYENILVDISQSQEINHENLLGAPAFNVFFTDYNVITSISRP